MKQILLTTVLSLSFATATVAQEKLWTLDECMRYAVENSPSVKKQVYTSDTYKAERNAAVASFFPAASAKVGAQYSFGRSIDPATNTYENTSTFNNNYGLDASIPIFTGGQLINQWLMAKSNRRMGVNDIQKAKDDLAMKTMQAYMDVVHYKGKLLPSIYLNAGISTSYFENLKSDNAPEGFKDQFKNNRGEYVSFSLSFPLFDGLSRLTNARRYRNNMRIARETRTEVFRQLQTAVEQSVLDREGYAKEAIQMDKKVRSDELAYRVTLRKYEEGLMSTLDVQTSANTLLESKANLLQKRLMYLLKSKLVDYYKGKPLINE